MTNNASNEDTQTVCDVLRSESESTLVSLDQLNTELATAHNGCIQISNLPTYESESPLYATVTKQLFEIFAVVEDISSVDIQDELQTILLSAASITDVIAAAETFDILDYYETQSQVTDTPPNILTPPEVNRPTLTDVLEIHGYDKTESQIPTLYVKEKQQIVQETLSQIFITIEDMPPNTLSMQIQAAVLYTMLLIDSTYATDTYFEPLDDSPTSSGFIPSLTVKII